ncbi:hypothetical protein CHX26_02875 [Porphyrobacter sp. HT-58-2]|uniref:DUF1330 domain-containing protein n=1 Tax=Porphyrobacter sp. HT-58-2 TaxID=2023229 RepID=UPI000CDBEC07|nr:DUF1330 domain-containing protein [Porphyrobacter sp. HT-58-2]AUX68594.1 hypothetical protein CHX26_02875 [Porphyrobacter sp. HT-58-2]
MTDVAGAFLVIRSNAPDILFREFREAVAERHPVAGAARLHEVALLEPGSVAAHTMILPFADNDAARDAFAAMPVELIAMPAAPLALLTGAVAAEGFPDPAIPTKANVPFAEEDGPVLMLIEGTGRDQDRMDQYRDILLPMMFDLGAYYTVFDLGGSVEVLSGSWDEAIFAISRWPSRGIAERFWMSERYQRDAIPLRIDIGRFEVALIPETIG